MASMYACGCSIFNTCHNLTFVYSSLSILRMHVLFRCTFRYVMNYKKEDKNIVEKQVLDFIRSYKFTTGNNPTIEMIPKYTTIVGLYFARQLVNELKKDGKVSVHRGIVELI